MTATLAVLTVAVPGSAVLAVLHPRWRTALWLIARSAHPALACCAGLAVQEPGRAAVVVLAVSLVGALTAPLHTPRPRTWARAGYDVPWWFLVAAVVGLGAVALREGQAPHGLLVPLICVGTGLGLVCELMAGRGGPGRRGRSPLLTGELWAILSIAATAAALVVGGTRIGWWFVPIALAPLVNIAGALQVRARALAVEDETVQAVSRLSEVAGFTSPGHCVRVEGVAAQIGALLGLDPEEAAHLRLACLLHDVGLVSLRTSIRGGSTSLLAPRDQQRIAARSAEIAAELPADPRVIDVLQHQAHPYIDHVMYRADVPLGARILKVANALDDYAEGSTAPRTLERALARIVMQQGYEFDPEVVAAVRAVLRDAPAALSARRGGGAAPECGTAP